MAISKSLLQWVFRIGVAAALLFILFRFVPFADVINVIGQADGRWVAAGFVLLFFEGLTNSLRMKLLTDQFKMPLSLWKIWEISTISTFYATFLPGDLAGGAVRWYRMSKPSGQRAEAFAALAFSRLADTIILLLSGLIFWFWDDPPFGNWLLDLIMIGVLGGLVLVMVFSLSPRTSGVVLAVINWLPGRKVSGLISEKAEKVLSSLRKFRDLSFANVSALVVLSTLRQILAILMTVCFAEAIAVAIGFSTIGWIRSLMRIITMLPIAFAGLGVREASFAILLEPYGIPAFQAVALSLFAFIVHLVLALIGGVLELRYMFTPQPEPEFNIDIDKKS